MNFRVLLAFLLLTVALISAAPIEIEEVDPTLTDEGETGETYEETFDERGFPVKRETNEASEEASTETATSTGYPVKRETNEPSEETTTETTSTDDRDGRKAFNAELVNVMIDAVDGVVDVAVGAVNQAVDVALGTVTGAANVAAGTVNGAMSIVSNTVDGTLNVISTTVNKGPRPSTRPQASPPAYQPANPIFASPQLASPAQPIVSRPIAAPQNTANIIGTPTGPITSNAVTRDMASGETAIITAEETPMADSFTVGTSMTFEDTLPVASTKPAVIESVAVGNTEEIASIATPIAEPSPIASAIVIEEIDSKFTPIISPIIVESIDAPQMETGFTPIDARNAENAVVETDEAPVSQTETVITEDIAETIDDDIIREKRAPHDHEHGDHDDCDEHSSHEKDE